jgi:hypothetical protein
MKALILAATILALAAPADAGKRRCPACECPVASVEIPACVPGDPNPPTCVAADGTVIDDATRAHHCATFCVQTGDECATCIASDTYGFPNCKWTACD